MTALTRLFVPTDRGWAVSFRGFLWLLAALTPVYLVLAAVLPPLDDELYYWCWAHDLQLSYYDHPPMVAYMIKAAVAVFGDTRFAVRLPAVVSTLVTLGVIGWLTRPRTLLPLIAFSPLFTFGAVVITPDSPLILFWSLYVVWLVKVHERLAASGRREPLVTGQEQPAHAGRSPESVPLWLWAVGGVVLGCGILGKYTTGLAMIAGFLSFVLAGKWRRWFVGYALHIAVAFVVSLPILIYNIRQDFVPLRFQWGHSMSTTEPGLKPLLEFAGVQLLLFGLLPFVVAVWAIRHRRELFADPRLRVCACLFVFPFLFFLYKSTRGPLEGNWALACYIAVWPLAAVMVEHAPHVWRRLAPLAFTVPAGCVVVLAVHLVRPVSFISPQADRVTRQFGKDQVADDVARTLHQIGATDPVFATSLQWTSLLRFHGVNAQQIEGITRPSHFTRPPHRPTDHDHVYVFGDIFIPQEFVAGFDPPKPVAVYPLYVRGELVGGFWLLEYTRPPRDHGRAAATPAGRPERP